MALATSERRPAYPLRSVAKALEMLLLFRDHDRIGVAEASRQLGVARSTAHRLVSMLEYYGFTQRDAKAQYRPGPALVGLGLAAVERLDTRRRAHTFMEQLAAEVRETVTLMALEGPDVRFIDCVESPQAIRVTARTGLLRPAHCTSAGKAILAAVPSDELTRLYPNEELEGLTDRSVRTRTDLFASLERVRRQGYATNLGESDEGLRAVGVAIPAPVGHPTAGFGIAAPADRLKKKEIERVAAAALRAARGVTQHAQELAD